MYVVSLRLMTGNFLVIGLTWLDQWALGAPRLAEEVTLGRRDLALARIAQRAFQA